MQTGAMRYIIIGAGAIGATMGGLLADGGHDVVLTARGEHADVLRRDGLTLRRPDRELHLRLPVFAVPDLQLTTDDVLIVAVKSQHTESILNDLVGLEVDGSTAGERLPLVSAQNGVSNEPAALRLFARVYGISLILPATHLEPGVVIAEGSPTAGVLRIGRYPSGLDEVTAALAGDLAECGFVAEEKSDVMAWKRSKLLSNLGNALEVLEPADPDAVQAAAEAEAQRCFEAAQLSVISPGEFRAPPGDQARPVPVDGHTRSGGSTWQSVQRGQGSIETDYLNGEIVLLGRQLGIDTPVNADIQRRMRALQA